MLLPVSSSASRIFFQVTGSEIKALFDLHGPIGSALLGTLSDGEVDGWWTELPSRKPPSDAGSVSFSTVTEKGDTYLLIGKCSCGTNLRDLWVLE